MSAWHKPKVSDPEALARICAGESGRVDLSFADATAQIERGTYLAGIWTPHIHWSVTSGVDENSGKTRRIEIAWQWILIEVARLAPPPPVELSVFESRRLAERASTVDGAVKLYRELLTRRTGRRWSVRVGSGARRSTITIASMPGEHVASGMRACDAAFLAALAGRRQVLNPLTGLQVHTEAERVELAMAFVGGELESETRVAQ